MIGAMGGCLAKDMPEAENGSIEGTLAADLPAQMAEPVTPAAARSPSIPEGKPDGEFETFQRWVNHATSWIGGRNALCVDTKDRVCRCGGDMMRARDENAFPVRYYFGFGGETAAQNRKSKAAARKAMRLQYPWRYS